MENDKGIELLTLLPRHKALETFNLKKDSDVISSLFNFRVFTLKWQDENDGLSPEEIHAMHSLFTYIGMDPNAGKKMAPSLGGCRSCSGTGIILRTELKTETVPCRCSMGYKGMIPGYMVVKCNRCGGAPGGCESCHGTGFFQLRGSKHRNIKPTLCGCVVQGIPTRVWEQITSVIVGGSICPECDGTGGDLLGLKKSLGLVSDNLTSTPRIK